MQGDCLSAILFILYLAKALKYAIKTKMKGKVIKPKHAGDITYAVTSKMEIDRLEIKIPELLQKYYLKVNGSNAERYEIPKPKPPPSPPPTIETLLNQKMINCYENKLIFFMELKTEFFFWDACLSLLVLSVTVCRKRGQHTRYHKGNKYVTCCFL